MDASARSCHFARMIRVFDDVPDPRQAGKVTYSLTDLLALVILAVISGAEGPSDVAEYGRRKAKWLAGFLGFDPEEMPSHDTVGRVLSLVHPLALEAAFTGFAEHLADAAMAFDPALREKTGLHLDGKFLRHAFDKAKNRSAVALVSAFCSASGLVLGQVGTELGKAKDSEEYLKTNEIPAIKQLLELLTVKDKVVTIDAMGCQRAIAEQIIDRGGDYLLAVKDNHKALHEDLKLLFKDAIEQGFEGMSHDVFESVEKGHGRIETRKVYVTREVGWLRERGEWAGLRSAVRVDSTREVLDPRGGKPKVSRESRLYISSLDHRDPVQTAAWFGRLVRGHWGIENKVHWVLDVVFREDDLRLRQEHLAENFSRMQRWVLNLLRSDKKNKASVKCRRKIAAWDEDYPLELLGLGVGGIMR